MSLWVAVPCALASAAVYGAATAVQHRAAHRVDAPPTVSGLVGLLRDRRWLLSVGGDSVGLVLQIAALATGPVVLIQPLLVLALPVALPVGWRLGGPRPQPRDAVAVAGIVAALVVFFLLVGDPGSGRALHARAAAVTTVALLGVAGAAAVAPLRRRATRAAVLGAAAGAGFGTVGVLINAVSVAVERTGWSALTGRSTLSALVGVVVVGATAVTLTQLSFQVGELRASFPANESAAPLVAVALGAGLLHEHIPLEPAYLLGYGACAAAIVAGTVRLAAAEAT